MVNIEICDGETYAKLKTENKLNVDALTTICSEIENVNNEINPSK